MEKISAIESMTKVMAEVSGVAKRDKNQAQGFSFRGIDAVVNAIGPVLRKVGGAIVPEVIDAHYDRGTTRSGTPTVEAFLTVKYSWYGTDGGDPIVGVVRSEAMDTSDKATAKAMSVALRTYLLQSLMLPTDEADPDSEYIERAKAVKVEIPHGFMSLVEKAKSMDELNELYRQAVEAGFADQVKESFTTQKKILTAIKKVNADG